MKLAGGYDNDLISIYRAVVTTFGVEESRRIYTADSFVKGDNIITTWVVSSGHEYVRSRKMPSKKK